MGEDHRYYYTRSMRAITMASAQVKRLESTLGFEPSGDVVGGVVLAFLGIIHLFVLQLSGIGGSVLLFAVWPLLGGAVGSFVEQSLDRDPPQDLRLTAVLSGVFGALITVALILLTGLGGLWSGFIHTTFGVELLPVTLSALILLTISWAVLASIGGFVHRRATAA